MSIVVTVASSGILLYVNVTYLKKQIQKQDLILCLKSAGVGVVFRIIILQIGALMLTPLLFVTEDIVIWSAFANLAKKGYF